MNIEHLNITLTHKVYLLNTGLFYLLRQGLVQDACCSVQLTTFPFVAGFIVLNVNAV